MGDTKKAIIQQILEKADKVPKENLKYVLGYVEGVSESKANDDKRTAN